MLELDFLFSDAFSVEVLQIFQGEVKIFSRFCNIFPGFCQPPPPCFPGLDLFSPVFHLRCVVSQSIFSENRRSEVDATQKFPLQTSLFKLAICSANRTRPNLLSVVVRRNIPVVMETPRNGPNIKVFCFGFISKLLHLISYKRSFTSDNLTKYNTTKKKYVCLFWGIIG